jgi:hypothetical protein
MPNVVTRSTCVAILCLTGACGIRTPAQQCQQAVSRSVACGDIPAPDAAQTLAMCTTALTQSSKNCQHAYNRLVDCLENYDCYDLSYGACQDYFGDAATLCPLLFVDEATDAAPPPVGDPNAPQKANTL